VKEEQARTGIQSDRWSYLWMEHYKYGGQMIEGFKPGDGILRTVETPFGTLSGIICWDTDFPAAVSQAGRNGTDILLSPSMDYRAVDPIHAYMWIDLGFDLLLGALLMTFIFLQDREIWKAEEAFA
jgi:hypothetical protein